MNPALRPKLPSEIKTIKDLRDCVQRVIDNLFIPTPVDTSKFITSDDLEKRLKLLVNTTIQTVVGSLDSGGGGSGGGGTQVWYTIPSASTIAPDLGNGSLQLSTFTLSTNTVDNPTGGNGSAQELILWLHQDASGGRSVVFGNKYLLSTGRGDSPSGAPNSSHILILRYNASLDKWIEMTSQWGL